jgi:acyl carrier protein
MSTEESIHAGVLSIVEPYIKNGKDVDLEKDLYSDLGVESVNAIQILLSLEEQFGVSIDDNDFIQARTAQQIIELVQKLKG